VTSGRKSDPETYAFQDRAAGPQATQRFGPVAEAAGLVVVLGRLQRNVVPEPLGLLMSVGVTADVDQQARVVDGRTRLVVQVEPLRQSQRDQTLAQDVFHGLAEAEVDSERERSDELGEAKCRS
jgi:hypothetical protein